MLWCAGQQEAEMTIERFALILKALFVAAAIYVIVSTVLETFLIF